MTRLNMPQLTQCVRRETSRREFFFIVVCLHVCNVTHRWLIYHMTHLNVLWLIWMCYDSNKFAVTLLDLSWLIWMCRDSSEYAMAHLNVLWLIWTRHDSSKFAVTRLKLPWLIWICYGSSKLPWLIHGCSETHVKLSHMRVAMCLLQKSPTNIGLFGTTKIGFFISSMCAVCLP